MLSALGRSRDHGFTILEVVVAAFVIGVFSAGALWSLAQVNYYAQTSRLSTAAQMLVQQQLDQMETAGPFNPQRVPPQIPPVLAATSASGVTETGLPLFADSQSGSVVVQASRTRTVVQTDAALRLFRISSRVTYTYRGRDRSIQLSSLRTSDE